MHWLFCATVGADRDRPLHLHPQMLPGKLHGGKDCQKGIPFAAPGAACLADALQRPGSHLIAQSPGLPGQGRGVCGDGHELPRADARPAGTPETAGAAGDLICPGCISPEGPPPDPACRLHSDRRQQCRPYHHMVLRAVHMAKGQIHHPADDGHRVSGSLRKAQSENAVHSLGVAVAAYIVSVHAAGLAAFLPMADGALHFLLLRQVFQRCLANQAFFSVQLSRSSHSRNTASCWGVWNQCSPPSITVSAALCCRTYSSTVPRAVIGSPLPQRMRTGQLQ